MPQASSSSVRVFYPKYSRSQIIRMLQESLPKLKEHLDLKLVVLFGSYATGRYTVASDVDLLVVYEGPERDDAYALCKNVLKVPRLEPHVFSAERYEEMKESIAPMIHESVVLISSFDKRNDVNVPLIKGARKPKSPLSKGDLGGCKQRR